MTRADCGGTEADTVGFVLAGGKSTRMGRDKASLSFAGQPLAIRALNLLREAGLPASLAGASPALASFAPVVEDIEPGLGPLGGICAALACTPAHWAVFLPVDLPLLPASLITLLVHHAQVTTSAVTLPAAGGFSQTFPLCSSFRLCRVTSALQPNLRPGAGGVSPHFRLPRPASASRFRWFPLS